MRTPATPELDDLGGEIVLQGHGQAVVHVHLHRDQEELAHAEDWNVFHGWLSVTRCQFSVGGAISWRCA